MSKPYLFTSERLGFRNWRTEDIPLMAAVSADPEVMEFFPAPATYEQTEAFVIRMQELSARRGHCYFPAFRLEDDQFIGFIGMGYKDFPASFTPCADIGWRLAKAYWGQGYATEGAKRCLRYAIENLGLRTVKAIASASNERSLHVMRKIGMEEEARFQHPQLADHPKLVECVCYSVSAY